MATGTFRSAKASRTMRVAVVVAALLGTAAIAASVAIATHEPGHTRDEGAGLQEVKVVRHSFPVATYPGGQWLTTSDTADWVDVPGAQSTITVPDGQKALIIVRFSPSVICSGSGICESRILIGGVEGGPQKPVYFNPGSTNHWGVMYTERSRGPLSPGQYVVKAQVMTTYGLSGTTLYVRSYHLTVERIRAT